MQPDSGIQKGSGNQKGSGIREGEFLPLETAGERLKAGRYAMDRMREKGFPVKSLGGRVYVSGTEVLAWFHGLPPAGGGEAAAAV